MNPTRYSIAAAAILAATVTLGAPRSSVAETAKPDGATIHKRFDDVDKWSKVFDDPKRDEWQRPEQLVAALSLAPGMAVADIGAGTGYFSKQLSAAVGPHGAVFVVEVEANLVAHLRDRAQQENTPNVIPVLASADNPRLPPASIDVALIVDTFHHIDERRRYLAVLRRSLRREARVAIVDWKAGKQPVGPSEEHHKIPRDQVEREMLEAGFELVASPDLLPHQYVLVFRTTPAPQPSR